MDIAHCTSEEDCDSSGPFPEKRPQVAEYVRRFGGSASISLLDPACAIFHSPDIDGIIGYRDEWGTSVVFGDPVCSEKDKPLLANAFQKRCKELGKSAIYITISKAFMNFSLQNGCGAVLEIGEELVLDPINDPTEGAKGRVLRNKLSKAVRSRVSVHEYVTVDTELEHAIEKVGATWLKSRQGPQIFLAHVNLFVERCGKRWFYAKQGDEIVGVVLLNQLAERQGWLVNLLMTTPHAEGGTPELLIVSVLEALRREGCPLLSVGVVVANELVNIQGLNPLTVLLARKSFRIIKKAFSLDGRRKFWQKFSPQGLPTYVVFSKPRLGLREVMAIKRAMNATL